MMRMGRGEKLIEISNLIDCILYRTLNIVRVIKSERLRCSGQVGRMREDPRVFKILTGQSIRRSGVD